LDKHKKQEQTFGLRKLNNAVSVTSMFQATPQNFPRKF